MGSPSTLASSSVPLYWTIHRFFITSAGDDIDSGSFTPLVSPSEATTNDAETSTTSPGNTSEGDSTLWHPASRPITNKNIVTLFISHPPYLSVTHLTGKALALDGLFALIMSSCAPRPAPFISLYGSSDQRNTHFSSLRPSFLILPETGFL